MKITVQDYRRTTQESQEGAWIDNTGEDSDGLHLGKFEKRRPPFFKFMSVYIKISFTQRENHSQLLCGLDFANERLLLCQFDV